MNFEATFPLRVCLNLDRRPDRWAEVRVEFARGGVSVERWRAVDGSRVRNRHGYSWPSRYGVSLTKRLVVRAARGRGAEAVFLFEDDVVLHPQWRQRIEGLRLPEDWGMFLLGCQHTARPQPVAPGLVRVDGAVDNHAIGIRRCWYERVLFTLRHGRDDAEIWPHTASDRHLAALMEEVPTYAAWPNLAWQRPSLSDQTGRVGSAYNKCGAQISGRQFLRHLEGFWQPAASGGAPTESGPWMHVEEVAFVKSVLRPDMTVLEYGTGGSTREFSALTAGWHAVEHDAAHYRQVCGGADGKRLTVYHVPPAWPQENIFSPAQTGQFMDYSSICGQLGLTFDAVLVDGRARVDCALRAASVMRPGAWLFFHDYYKRPRYLRRAGELLPFFRLVKSFRHTPQTMAVFRRRH